MGEVWRATDTKLNREVAIKVLPEAFAKNPDRMARFAREALVLASLNHPNIAAIYGVEERALILELVEGPTLGDRLERGAIAMDEAIPLIDQLIDALEYAHEKGIVHRDLKPANIKVTPDGRLKVLDFGLAKALSPVAGAGNPDDSPTLTMGTTIAGTIMGTAAYMSPEQARGLNVDKRTDLWSFGVVLYEILTGRRLFDGVTVADPLAAVLGQDADLTAVPARFHRLLRLCLTRDPRQRLRDISGARLLLEEPALGAAAVRVTARRPWGWVAAGVLALALAGVLASILGMGRRAPSSLLRFSIDLGPEAIPGLGSAGEFSPDGAHIAFTTRGNDGRNQLAIRRTDQDKIIQLPGTEGGFGPFFSPNGKWIGFLTPNQLKKIPVQGGAAVKLCDVADARGATWAADGSIVLAAGTTTGLSRVSDSGGACETLTDPSTKGQRTHRWPQFLPGGKTVLFTAHISASGFDDAEIDALDLKTHTWKTVMRGGSFGRYLPSGHLVFVRQGTLYAVRLDLSRLETTGTPVPILDDVATNPFTGSGRFDAVVTPFGSGLFTYVSGKPRESRRPVVWLYESGKTQPLLPTADSYMTPRLSPNGQLLAISAGSLTAAELYVWDMQRETRTQLTFNAQSNSWPVWAPDGKHLIFVSYTNAQYTIWWARTDGASQPVKLLESPDALFPGAISPDGRRFAYDVPGPGTGRDLWTVPLDLSDPESPKAGKPEIFLQTPKGEFSPSFSPDGRWIAYISEDSGQPEVYVRPFPGPGGKWVVSATGGANPRRSRGARQLFYETLAGRMMVADYDARGDSFVPGTPHPWGAPRTLLQTNSSYDIAPDGKRVAAFVSEEPDTSRGNPHLTVLLNFFDELKRRVP